MLDIPNWHTAVTEIRELVANPEVTKSAKNFGAVYRGKRGLMIVDVVSSSQRRYEQYVKPKLLPLYESKAKDLSISALAKVAPQWMPLRTNEAKTMQLVAKVLLKYGATINSTDEEKISLAWAQDAAAQEQVLAIKGIGPALLQYLRMRCGANTIKVDVRVKEALRLHGIPVQWFTDDGLLELCTKLSTDIGCSLPELDQALWNR